MPNAGPRVPRRGWRASTRGECAISQRHRDQALTFDLESLAAIPDALASIDARSIAGHDPPEDVVDPGGDDGVDEFEARGERGFGDLVEQREDQLTG